MKKLHEQVGVSCWNINLFRFYNKIAEYIKIYNLPLNKILDDK